MIFRIADEYKIADSSFSCYIDGFSGRCLFSGRKTCLWARPQKYFTHLIFEEFQ